ncbi:DUF5367 family protein [Fulvivirga lutea]|uniref:DUF5367 family protein n=1 Tax=Fulvivirga lutea TaxID=2810512 RepID=A0A974WNM1_9BACT|nr:DUF5367 family protein [Fulvivirga lutea]QSE98793.1 DUF5367 family protein [Fulvivirga lutea]
MKSLNLKQVVISSLVVYIIGITAFVGSYFVEILENANQQANYVLMLAIIPAALIGAYLYYRRGYQTNGFLLGTMMFLGAMLLDAIITVPVFIIPNGGDYLSFFGDPGFWLIAVEYISVVAAYWKVERMTGRLKTD